MQEVSERWKIPSSDKCISGDFSSEEFAMPFSLLKSGTASRPDSICPELIIHAGAALKSWLNKLWSFCMRQFKLPKIWRRALVFATSKPNRPRADLNGYKPISLLCIPHEIWKRLIYARVESIIDPLLPREQDGF